MQAIYGKSGRFCFTGDEKSFLVEADARFVIPSEAGHDCLCLEPGELIDSSPPRCADFL